MEQKIRDSKKLHCVWSFNHDHFYKKENFPFFSFNGKCTDPTCKANLIGKCSKEPEGHDSLIIKISAYETFNKPLYGQEKISWQKKRGSQKSVKVRKSCTFQKQTS